MKKVIFALVCVLALMVSCSAEKISDEEKLHTIDEATPVEHNGVDNGTPPPPNG